jgi:CRP/FNR family cyclic AMP-dependent transcriptional regulator
MEISHHTWLKSSIGRELSEGEARELFMISKREHYARGERLFAEGDEATSLYLVAEGEVDIVQRRADGTGDHVLARHQAGAIVGEMSLLTREARSASAHVASVAATILRVTARDLEELLGREPTVAYKLMYALARLLATRLRAVNHRVTDMSERTANANPHEQIEEFAAFKKKLFTDWTF